MKLMTRSKGMGSRLAAAALGMAVVATSAGVARATEVRRPNIVVLITDDMGYADLGFHGNRDFPTPRIDALAAGGVRCTDGYVSGLYCSPTRAGFLTGRYQQRFGHEWNPGGGGKAGLPTTETTIADRLKGVGYATGLVGKWHLGGAPELRPQRRGFDEFFGFLGGAHTYFAEATDNIYRGTEVVKEEAYLTDAFAREAVAFIDRHKEGPAPFFLEVAFNAVHTPMDATDERLARFASIEDPVRRKYAAMLTALDDAVGAIVDKLQASGLAEDTLIVYFNDNGGPTMTGTTQNGSSNAPFRGSKRTSLEGGVRVPFVLSWPGKLPANAVYRKPVVQLDLLPTALAAAGAEVKPEWKLDGVDLFPFLSGVDSGSPHDALFWRMGEQAAVRRGDWKLVRYDSTVDSPGARSNAARVVVTPFRLYNLAEDPGESRDLAAEEPEKVKELLAAWQVWDAQLVDPLWGPARSTRD
ncbi:sulfatase-like hydrolase/transferase [Planctomyces sp. SH-PL62]|uniref:sulfatase-like hydrolase/transferase n=1 Tax=Planctomyces sp. SH-PL62 TaxID=1636152 RepID=UPI00078BC2BD|nr:sulfatase-like hydrolase/transferase [Planctomyces sp. SH-PL62]AMV40318.1 Arylsulfatase precursor [Planctomyces sp. SH-PL62]